MAASIYSVSMKISTEGHSIWFLSVHEQRDIFHRAFEPHVRRLCGAARRERDRVARGRANDPDVPREHAIQQGDVSRVALRIQYPVHSSSRARRTTRQKSLAIAQYILGAFQLSELCGLRADGAVPKRTRRAHGAR